MMFSLSVTTQPTAEPVTLDEAKLNMRFPYDTEDQRILSIIKAARMYCETVVGKSLMTQTLTLKRDAFPNDCEAILLPRSPVQSVTSVSYVDTAGSTQTISSALYQSDVTSLPPRIAMLNQQPWPITDVRMSAVTVVYVAGYTSAALVPETIKQAMHLLVSHWFNNREAAGDSRVDKITAMAVGSLLGSEWSGNLTGAFG
jgi:uncharacterized phiE125 gp8 family phage protein